MVDKGLDMDSLDELDLAGLELTEEDKKQLREFDVSIDRIVTLLNGLKDNKLSNELEKLSKELSKNNSWKKIL